jgi:hypothetical protein
MAAQKQKMMIPTEKAETRSVIVTTKKEVELPPFPKLGGDDKGMRMVYNNGKSRDIIAKTMLEVMIKADAKAREDGFNFRNANHVISWEAIPKEG